MGQISSKSRRASDSSTALLNEPLGWRQSDDLPDGFLYTDYHAKSSHDTNNSSVSSLSGSHTGITRPAPPPRLHRVSELIDPYDLIGHCPEEPDCKNARLNGTPVMSYKAEPDINKCLPPLIESPFGNVLGAQEFLAHPNRPLAIRERQESIRRALEEAEREELGKIEEPQRTHQEARLSQKETTTALVGGVKVPTDKFAGCLYRREKGGYKRIQLAEERENGCCFGWVR